MEIKRNEQKIYKLFPKNMKKTCKIEKNRERTNQYKIAKFTNQYEIFFLTITRLEV